MDIVLSELINTVWILKHVKSVDNIKLDFTKIAEVIGVLLAARPSIVLLHLLQLHVDFVLDRAVPATDLAVVKGGQDAALWVERGELD